jgi:hypothetical protein
MSKTQTATGFTPGERDYIRRELDMFFSTLPTVAEGFQLKTWRGGPEAGRPKLSPHAKGLLERGLMRLDTSQRLPRLFFTEAGLAELRRMMADRRLADPKKFAHIRQELGLDPMPHCQRTAADWQAGRLAARSALRKTIASFAMVQSWHRLQQYSRSAECFNEHYADSAQKTDPAFDVRWCAIIDPLLYVLGDRVWVTPVVGVMQPQTRSALWAMTCK